MASGLTRSRASVSAQPDPVLSGRSVHPLVLRAGELLLAVAPGVLVFVTLYGALLNPRRVDWVFAPNPVTFDAATSALGWMYFQAGSWHWPPGSNPDYGGAIADSLLFSDSVPAWSVPVKLVFGALGVDGPTQVIGLGVLVCLLLQSGLAYAVVRAFRGSRPLAVCGAGFVCLMPAVLLKWNIVSLFWQWLVLAAILLVVLELRPRWRVLGWLALTLFSTGITPYVTLMVLTFGCLDVALRGWADRSWRLPLQAIPAMAAAALLGLYLWGVFSIGAGEAVTGQLGEYSAGGLSLVDSAGFSWFLRDLPGGSIEGYGYLGLGVLLLLVAGAARALPGRGPAREVAAAAWRHLVTRPGRMAAGVGALLLAAFSGLPRPSLGTWGFELPLPETAIEVLSVFRANGRFLWPLMYMLVLGAVILAASLSRTRGTVIVALALALQVADLSPLLRLVRGQVADATAMSPRYQPELAAVFDAPGVEGVEVVPAFPYPPTVPWREVGLAAHRAGHTLDTLGYFNRYDSAEVSRIVDRGLAAVRERTLRPDRAYVVSKAVYSESLEGWPGAEVLLRIDDWVVLRAAGPARQGPVVAPSSVPTVGALRGFSARETDASGGVGYWLTSPTGTLRVTGPPGASVQVSLTLTPTPCGPVQATIGGSQVRAATGSPVQRAVRLDASGQGVLPLSVASPACSPSGDSRTLYALVYAASVRLG